MNNSSINQTIYDVAAQTLEQLALMFLVPPEEASQGAAATKSVVRISFTGPFNGELAMAVAADLLPSLAANMLGLEDGSPASPEQQADALKELANVVCGNLLPAIAGPLPVFHVGSPELNDTGSSINRSASGPQAGSARVLVDAGTVELSLFVDRPAALRNVA